jgi:hypothetical protein
VVDVKDFKSYWDLLIRNGKGKIISRAFACRARFG